MQGYRLETIEGNLCLMPENAKIGGPVYVDFSSGASTQRLKTSGVKQDIAKACGFKKGIKPTVLDATAGLGADAFVLASLGAQVDLLERNSDVYALLNDGLLRALAGDTDIAAIANRMTLLACQESVAFLQQSAAFDKSYDCVFLDPMFPERSKAAKVKKAMQYLHDVAGIDEAQEPLLLNAAKALAQKRVVAKRPKLAPYLADVKPDLQFKGKTLRYDVYFTHR